MFPDLTMDLSEKLGHDRMPLRHPYHTPPSKRLSSVSYMWVQCVNMSHWTLEECRSQYPTTQGRPTDDLRPVSYSQRSVDLYENRLGPSWVSIFTWRSFHTTVRRHQG